MKKLSLLRSSYDFTLPSELIATSPAPTRDSSKLLVYNRATDEITHAIFADIEQFIPDDCALIFNNTKVIKARLFAKKLSGAKLELLINKPLPHNRVSVYIKGRVKVGTTMLFDQNLSADVVELVDDGSRIVEFKQSNHIVEYTTLLRTVEKIGHTPLPPYIKRQDNLDDESNYQSVFALKEGAVAAPTASLHFTDELHSKICKKHTHDYITLHIGAGTFKPVESEIITDHPMHSEYFEITDTTKQIINSTQKILCVGTTTTRTVEYFVRTRELSGEADLFLHPQNRPQRVDYLLTNFHLPASTLIMLVASFVGVKKTQELYAKAIEHRYRFYSYGDAMLII